MAVLDDYVGFTPALAIALLVSISLSTTAARRLQSPRYCSALLLMSLGLILSATITPSLRGLADPERVAGWCDLSRLTPPSLSTLATINDRTLNIVLFVPLGIAVAILPPRTRAIVAVPAIALPFGIELLQFSLPMLGRECQSADVIDNLTGFGLGLAATATAGYAGAALLRRTAAATPPRERKRRFRLPGTR